jgi:hypothetical protein
MELLMGFWEDLWINVSKQLKHKNINAKDRIDKLENIHILTHKWLKIAKVAQAKYYNQQRQDMPFKIS